MRYIDIMVTFSKVTLCLCLMMNATLHSCKIFSCFFYLIRKVTQAFCVIMKTGLYYLAGLIMKVIPLLKCYSFISIQAQSKN